MIRLLLNCIIGIPDDGLILNKNITGKEQPLLIIGQTEHGFGCRQLIIRQIKRLFTIPYMRQKSGKSLQMDIFLKIRLLRRKIPLDQRKIA